MIHQDNEDLGQENRNFSHEAEAQYGISEVQNPRYLDGDTFHENPEDNEVATSYGSANELNYGQYSIDRDANNYDIEETNENDFENTDEEEFDEENLDEEDLNDDFNRLSFNTHDFDIE